MLNVFLPFTNTFLLCLFFLAWLIPQFLQKSHKLGLTRISRIVCSVKEEAECKGVRNGF